MKLKTNINCPQRLTKKNKKNEDKKKKHCKFGLKDKIEKKNQNFIKGPRTKLYKSKE
jgi:hypothetical protein